MKKKIEQKEKIEVKEEEAVAVIKEENKKLAKKSLSLWGEFKAFISRGSVIDLAVGVIIGGAFNAIVTTMVNILLSLATWGVPGGLSGLVTLLPAMNAGQAGLDPSIGLGQSFTSDQLDQLAQAYAAKHGDPNSSLITIETFLGTKYTNYGGTYYYKGSAIIDWGSFINAIIAFFIVALTLFIILKVVNGLRNKRAELAAKTQEEYYKKHPEERPAPVVPGAPKLSETDLLVQIRDLLKKQQASAKKKV